MPQSPSCTHQTTAAPRLCSTSNGEAPNPRPLLLLLLLLGFMLPVTCCWWLTLSPLQGIKEHPWYVKELPQFLQGALDRMAQEQVGFYVS